MLKLLVCLLVACSLFPSENSYQVDMYFKKGRIVVNDKEVFCPCGRSPVCLMFFDGIPQYYCASHIPDIEFVKPISSAEIDNLLKSIGSEYNMNGAHNG